MTIACLQCGAQVEAERRSKKYCGTNCQRAFIRAHGGFDNIAYMQRYYAQHRAYFTKHNKRYYAEHRDAEKVRSTIYQQAHPEQARATNIRAKKRYRQTANGRAAAIRCTQKRRRLNVGAIDWKAWERKRRRIGKCVLCSATDKALTIDHIIPVSKGGTNDTRNLQPLCQPCNSRKSTTIYPGSQLILI